jgi:hypothetical protein
MADEVFRPSRRRMSADDVKGNDQGNEALNGVHAVQQAMAADVGQPGQALGGEPAFALKGNLPPAMLAAMQAQAEDEGDEEEGEDEHPFAQFRPPQAAAPSQVRPQSAFQPKPKKKVDRNGDGGTPNLSEQLEALLNHAKGVTQTYETVTLPSKGKFYDGTDGPTNGVLHVRPMTGQEEAILATPRHVKKGKAVDMIFANCIREKINPEALLTIDRTYLLIFLRGISYTPEYDVEIKCPECQAKYTSTVDLNSLEVDECPDDFDVDSLTDVLPKTGFVFTYRLSRGSDEHQVNQYRERRVKNFGDAGTDDTLAYRTSLLLEEVQGLRDKRQMQVLHKNLPMADVTEIRNVINEPPFGVKTDIDMQCPSCFAEFSVDLPLESNFFFPRRKKTETHA